jgi:hypothetical protein
MTYASVLPSFSSMVIKSIARVILRSTIGCSQLLYVETFTHRFL